MTFIDINSDLGEGETSEDCARDAKIMRHISRCNIACGGHAGNKLTMRLSLKNAQSNALKIGAHPGYPDKENFGRKSIQIPFEQLSETISQQIDLLLQLASQKSITIDHIKLHGALYIDAENSPDLATKLVELFASRYSKLNLLVLAKGAMQNAAVAAGARFLREGFMDRAYLNNAFLAPRSIEGAVYQESHHSINQAVALAKGHAIKTLDGQPLSIKVDSICLHGDGENAEIIASRLHQKLVKQGIRVR